MRVVRRLVFPLALLSAAPGGAGALAQEGELQETADVAGGAVSISPPPPAPARNARVVLLTKRGDEATARLEPQTALEAYQAAVSADPNDYEALWKTGRTLIDLGELERKGNSQKDKYNKALKYAERAIQVKPEGADGHYVRAYALGRVALFEGGKTKLRLSREVKAEALRAIDLDPLHDGAYNVLGDWNYDLADLNFFQRALAKTILGGVPEGASFENAAHYYQLAIQARPDRPAHHLEYARALLKLDREDEARTQLQRGLALPASALHDPSHKRVAEALLDDLSG
ncbi:MAG: tetratricopeptide repeat protein [Gemmatimonadota bacterium]